MLFCISHFSILLYRFDINDHSVEIAEIYSNHFSQKLRETTIFASKLHSLSTESKFSKCLISYCGDETFHLQARFLLVSVSVPYQKVAQYFSEPFIVFFIVSCFSTKPNNIFLVCKVFPTIAFHFTPFTF